MSLEDEIEEVKLEDSSGCEHDFETYGEEGWNGGTYMTAGKRCKKCGYVDSIPGWGTNPGAM